MMHGFYLISMEPLLFFFFNFLKNIFGKPAPKGPPLKFEVRMGRASNGRSVQ